MSTNSFDTMQVRPWTQPHSENFTPIKVNSHHNKGFPIGFTFLDIDRKDNIRIKTYVDSVTDESAQAHIDAWADTILYSASSTWLEICANDRDFQYGSFSTEDDHPWHQPQSATSRYIQFSKPFAATPHIVVWLNQLDLSKFYNWRINATASDITNTGFTIHIDTWGDSILYRGAISWIAHPSNRPNITSGSFNVTDVHPCNQSQLTNQNKLDFNKTFQTPPRVFAAFNRLDIGNAANLRIRLETKDISRSSMTWSIDAWGDTVLYSASVSYLAIQDF